MHLSKPIKEWQISRYLVKGLARVFLLDFQVAAYVQFPELASAKAKAGQKHSCYSQACSKTHRRNCVSMVSDREDEGTGMCNASR